MKTPIKMARTSDKVNAPENTNDPTLVAAPIVVNAEQNEATALLQEIAGTLWAINETLADQLSELESIKRKP